MLSIFKIAERADNFPFESARELSRRRYLNSWRGQLICLALIVLAQVTLWLFDSNPRFLLGDSVAYLSSTWENPYPPFSWLYGTFINLAGNYLPCLDGALYTQAAALVIAQFLLVRVLLKNGSGISGVVIFLVATSLSPILLYYTRAVLTDILAACLLVALVYFLGRIPRRFGPAAITRAVVLAFLSFNIVGLRSAYLPLVLGIGPLYALFMLLTGEVRRNGRHFLVIPVVSLFFGALAFSLVNTSILSAVAGYEQQSPRYLLALVLPAVSCDVVSTFDSEFDCDNLRRWRTNETGQRNENLFRADRFGAYVNRLAIDVGRPVPELHKDILLETINRHSFETLGVFGSTLARYFLPESYRIKWEILEYAEGHSYAAFTPEHERFAREFSGTPMEHINTGDFPPGFLIKLESKGWLFDWTEKTPNMSSFARSMLVYHAWIDWLLMVIGVALSLRTLYRWKGASETQRWAGLVILVYVPSLSLFAIDVIVRYLTPVSLMAAFLLAGLVRSGRSAWTGCWVQR